MPRLTSRVFPAHAWSEVEPTWTMLHAASRTRSFFLSPEWVGVWLHTYGAATRAQLHVFEDAGIPRGAAILAERVTRRLFIPVRELHFHTAGEPRGHGVAAEHAAPLCREHDAEAVLAALADAMRARGWDELHLSGVDETTLNDTSRLLPELAADTDWHPTYQVNLARLRESGTRYELALSKNTRDQLKRSLKRYRERGELRLTFAKSAGDALGLLEELAALHQQRWQGKGVAGAFASASWHSFHKRLITQAFPRGGVQLVRASAGDATIGLLYNFVQDGIVSFYQSGLQYEEDNRIKPGLVTHALVIQACIDRGLDLYDLLAGEASGSRYKESLATDSSRLAWSVMRRRTARTRVLGALRAIKRLAVNASS